jgi:hypothetical protein
VKGASVHACLQSWHESWHLARIVLQGTGSGTNGSALDSADFGRPGEMLEFMESRAISQNAGGDDAGTPVTGILLGTPQDVPAPSLSKPYVLVSAGWFFTCLPHIKKSIVLHVPCAKSPASSAAAFLAAYQ